MDPLRHKFQRIFILAITLFLQQRINSQCAVDFIYTNYFCDLDSIVVTAIPISGTPPYSFIWETGETTQSIIVPMAMGDYMLTMTDAIGCTAIINCHVKPIGNGLFYPYTPHACEGDTVNLFLAWWGDSIPGATYLWSTGETTPFILITDDIVWSATITDPGNGCEFIIPESLFDFHPTPYPQIVGPDVICEGQTITLSVAGGPFGIIIWYPEGYFGETYGVSEPGTYIVHATSPEVSYCAHQDTITITESSLVPVLSGPQELCPGQSGTITITNYTLFEEFIWSSGITDPSFTVTSPGSYTVTVTDQGGCTGSASITVDAGSGPSLSADVTGTTCEENNGSVDLTPTPIQSYTYDWSNGANTQDLVNIPAGNYTVTVTDLNGCTSTISVTVPNNPIPVSLSANITHNTMCANFNGAIDLSVLPLNEPYTYSWSNGATTQDLSNLPAGSYTVTVTTGVNCIETATFTVDDLSGAAEISSSVFPASCGESNGSATLSLSGGQSPFTYLWSNGNATESIVNVTAGTYSVTVTGSDGCTSFESIIIPNEDLVITITGNIFPNTSCTSGNGEIDVTVTPAGTYSFNWSNGSNSEDLLNLNAGTYTLTVSLGITCVETNSFTVTNENIPFDIQGAPQANTSCTTPNGAIDVSIVPNGIYTFIWASGETTEDLQNLDGGTYTVTVTDNSGCSISTSFTVSESNSIFSVSGVILANTSCLVPNGMIDIIVTPPDAYTILWSTGAQTEDLQNIDAGTYSITITNDDGCAVDTSFTVNDQSTSFTLSATPLDNTSCINPNGSIDLNVNPSGAYSYLWSNGTTTEDLLLITGGTYSVTVTDNNSCSAISTFTISENTSLPAINELLTNETCGAGNGSIDLTVSPPGSTFIWTGGFSTEDLQNLQAGTYSVTVTGPNGCFVSDTFNILNTNNNFSLSGITTDNTSCLSPNGLIDLSVNPGGTYSYVWSTGATTEDLQNIGAGVYQVTVTDNLNCSSSSTFSLQVVTVDPVISETIIPSSCGSANGSIILTITPSSGNVFAWSNGSSGKDLVNITAGTYAVTVTSSNGCSTAVNFVVPDNNSNFSINGNAFDNTSCTAPNGIISLNIVPSGTYIFSWSNGSMTSNIQNLGGGNYQVTVTDQFSCSSTKVFTIGEVIIHPEISYIVTPANCDQSDGEIDLSVSLTTGNTFSWSNGSSTEDVTNVLPGIYDVSVTASNGCTASASIEVPNQNSNFTISATVIDDQSCTDASGSINLTVTPGGIYAFQWSNGVISEDIINLASGIYEVTVTDFFNCSSSEIFTIEDATNPPILSEIITSATCGGSNAGINLTIIPATGNSFVWSTGDISEDLQSIPAGLYSVTVTDINGCTLRGEYSIPDSEPVEITIGADLSSLVVDGTVTCSLEINRPLTALDTIIWSPDAIMSCHDPLCVEQIFILQQLTPISVMAMDTNGCMGTANLLLDIDKEFKVYIPNVFTPNGDGPNDMFTVYTNDEVEEVVVLEIFDRWGNCVFINETFPPNQPSYGWDGVFKGQMMNPAVFVYRAVVRYSNGEEHSFKGDVTLMR